MKNFMIAALLLLLGSGSVLAAGNDLNPVNITNSEFATLVRELGMLSAYRAVAPAEPGGLTGFDFGIEASFAEIDTTVWDKVVSDGNAESYLGIARFHARKGLPFNLDVGVNYLYIPDSDVRFIGGELQWAVLAGSTVSPALALRGHYTAMTGGKNVDISSYGADAILSKGFAFFTPYIGGGVVQIDGKYTGSDPILLPLLQDQSATEFRGFGGVQIAMALVRLTLEAEYSRMPIYTAKLSLGW